MQRFEGRATDEYTGAVYEVKGEYEIEVSPAGIETWIGSIQQKTGGTIPPNNYRLQILWGPEGRINVRFSSDGNSSQFEGCPSP